jgi:hypothetical protein
MTTMPSEALSEVHIVTVKIQISPRNSIGLVGGYANSSGKRNEREMHPFEPMGRGGICIFTPLLVSQLWSYTSSLCTLTSTRDWYVVQAAEQCGGCSFVGL